MSDAPRNPPINNSPIRLAVCVSGEGTTLQNLIDQIKSRRLKAELVQVVASRPRIGAIARAESAKIPLALANYNARVGQKVVLRLRLDAEVSQAVSAYHGELKLEKGKGLIEVTIPALGYGDVLRLQ